MYNYETEPHVHPIIPIIFIIVGFFIMWTIFSDSDQTRTVDPNIDAGYCSQRECW